MAALSGVAPETTFTLRDQEIKGSSQLPPALASFLAPIKLKQVA